MFLDASLSCTVGIRRIIPKAYRSSIKSLSSCRRRQRRLLSSSSSSFRHWHVMRRWRHVMTSSADAASASLAAHAQNRDRHRHLARKYANSNTPSNIYHLPLRRRYMFSFRLRVCDNEIESEKFRTNLHRIFTVDKLWTRHKSTWFWASSHRTWALLGGKILDPRMRMLVTFD